MNHPLQFASETGSFAVKDEQQDIRYEDKVVSYLLYRFHISRYKSQLLTEGQRRLGKATLALPLFLEQFPSFPFYLTAACIPFIERECTVRRLFNSMSTRPMVKKYEEFVDEGLIPENFQDRPLGLVFPWPHIDHGLILHDGVTDIETKPAAGAKPQVKMIWTLPEQKRKWMHTHQGWATPYIVTEPFEQFVNNLVWEVPADQ